MNTLPFSERMREAYDLWVRGWVSRRELYRLCARLGIERPLWSAVEKEWLRSGRMRTASREKPPYRPDDL